MEKFNNTTLFTGYLKQLLHTFNLPKYRIYTKAQEEFRNKYGKERSDVLESVTGYYSSSLDQMVYPNDIRYIPYIKNGSIQQCIDGKWYDVGKKGNIEATHVHYYSYGMKILNFTRNLQIKNNTYDSYTHEYLGDYLRFLRDYNDINLMPLYNCFSDRRCDSLKISINNAGSKALFDTNDSDYKIYMLPVKLFQEYTIAVDSPTQIELCCGLYGAYQDTREKFAAVSGLTYKKIPCSYFSQPFLYSSLLQFSAMEDKNLLIELAQNECDLKLFIKVPVTNESTIVVLEGNYTTWNDHISDSMGRSTVNKTILNFEKLPQDIPFGLTTQLQLLRFNTGDQHPFADRLVEYLIGNAITSDDEISDNIKRVQKALKLNTLHNKNYQYSPITKGAWDKHINYVIYEYMNNNINTYEVNHDILGFVDKDVEKYYQYVDDLTENKISIANVDLSEEDK